MKKNIKEKNKSTEEVTEKKTNLFDLEYKTRIKTAVKSEMFRFIVGLICALFAAYMLWSFSSFFIAGGSDQSVLEHPVAGELSSSTPHIENTAGARGASLAEFLINRCFGIPAYSLVVFFVAFGLHLMQAYRIRVMRWFLVCFIGMYWCSIALGFFLGGLFENSFIYPGGLHGYRISTWLEAQVGAPGVCLLLLGSAILISLAITKSTMDVVRKAVHPNFHIKWKFFSKGKKTKSTEDNIVETENDNVEHIADPVLENDTDSVKTEETTNASDISNCIESENKTNIETNEGPTEEKYIVEKDAISCEKLGGGANIQRSRGVRMG